MNAGPAAIGVGFDIDHTIAIDNKLERVAFLRLLEAVVEAGGCALGSLEEEIVRIDDLLARQRRGEFTIDAAVEYFVRERGIVSGEAGYARRFRTLALDMADEFVVPRTDAKAAFEALRARGVRMAILSNGWNPLQTRKARRAGFDGTVLASAEIGVQKPDPRAFAALTARLQTAQTWYVGDDARIDVEGARAAGLRAVWLDADGTRFPADLSAPEFTVESLGQLAELVLASQSVA